MRKASAAKETASAKAFEMSSLKTHLLRVKNVEKHKRRIKIWEHFIIKTNSRVGFFPSVKIKTSPQIEGDTVCRQLQATFLITKRHLSCGNTDTTISLQHDIFILPDIMFYYCSVPPRATYGWMDG